MLRNTSEITGYILRARDEDIGRCRDFLFDDDRWTIRYMVASTGGWLPKQKVLVSPASIDDPEWKSRRLRLRLTKDRLESAPRLYEDEPVTRSYERIWARHHGLRAYWVGGGLWGAGAHPAALYGARHEADDLAPSSTSDPCLRSTKEVTGYHIAALDGEIGHVEDFILDDQTWTIRYLVIDTRSWLPAKKVLVSPAWVNDVSWAARKVYIDLTRESVKNAPEYRPHDPVNRAYEARLHDYHGRPLYLE